MTAATPPQSLLPWLIDALKTAHGLIRVGGCTHREMVDARTQIEGVLEALTRTPAQDDWMTSAPFKTVNKCPRTGTPSDILARARHEADNNGDHRTELATRAPAPTDELVERVARAMEIEAVEATMHHPVSRLWTQLIPWLFPKLARAALSQIHDIGELREALREAERCIADAEVEFGCKYSGLKVVRDALAKLETQKGGEA